MKQDDVTKDLTDKISMLRTALIAEKKKTNDLEQTVKTLTKHCHELEAELEVKDAEILGYHQEKHKLISQIDFHVSKSFLLENKEGKDKGIEVVVNNDSLIANKSFDDIIKEKIGEEVNPEDILKEVKELCERQALNELKEIAKVEPIVEKRKSLGFNSSYGSVLNQNQTPNIVNLTNQTNQSSNQLTQSTQSWRYTLTSFNNEFEIVGVYSFCIPSKNSTNSIDFNTILHLKAEINDKNILLAEQDKHLINFKNEFKMLISTLNQTNAQLQSELSSTRSDHLNTLDSLTKLKEAYQILEVNAHNSDAKLKYLEEEYNIAKESVDKFTSIISDQTSVIIELQEAQRRHEDENRVLAFKLAELKSGLLDQNIRRQVFTGKRKDFPFYKEFNLVFDTNQEYFIVKYSEDKGSKVEDILLTNIESIKVIDEMDNSVGFSFLRAKKKISYVLFLNENIHQMVKVFKDYQERAYKQSNQLI